MPKRLFIAAAAFSATLSATIAAEQADIVVERAVQTFEAAHPKFKPGVPDPRQYASDLLPGLTGKWVELSEAAIDSGSPINTQIRDYLERHCLDSRQFVMMSTNERYEFSMSRTFKIKDSPQKEIVFTYIARGGTTFAGYTDPKLWLEWLEDDKPDTEARSQIGALTRWFSTVNIFRPYPDILVFMVENTVPTIFVRCPAG